MTKLTTKVVAEALGLSERSIRLYASQGRIPFSETPGGHRRFDLDAVREALYPRSPSPGSETADGDIPSLGALRRRRRAIVDCARRHGAHRVRVFGSVAAGTADEESDIDLVVTLDADRGYADVDDLEAELRALLGRSVDVLTEDACHGRFAHVLDEAVAL